MTTLRAHKVGLDPTNRQATAFARAAGCARFAYNWALAEWDRQYAAWRADPSLPKPDQFALRRQLTQEKKGQFSWMFEVTKCAPEHAILDLGKAFSNYFAGRGRYPRFHRKGTHDSFYLDNDQFKVQGRRVWCPKIGWIRTKEHFRFPGAKIMSATFSKRAGKWYVAITAEIEGAKPAPPKTAPVGVDLNISQVVLSTGQVFYTSKPLEKALAHADERVSLQAHLRWGAQSKLSPGLFSFWPALAHPECRSWRVRHHESKKCGARYSTA